MYLLSIQTFSFYVGLAKTGWCWLTAPAFGQPDWQFWILPGAIPGGNEDLRGYRRERFAGSKFFNQTELRAGNGPTCIPISSGINWYVCVCWFWKVTYRVLHHPVWLQALEQVSGLPTETLCDFSELCQIQRRWYSQWIWIGLEILINKIYAV